MANAGNFTSTRSFKICEQMKPDAPVIKTLLPLGDMIEDDGG